MIWNSLPRMSLSTQEPIELRILKQQLANLTCECSTCRYSDESSFSEIQNLDKEVQVGRTKKYNNKFIQVCLDQHGFVLDGNTSELRNVRNNRHLDACSACFFALNMLRGFRRVLKDEESETKAEVSDKSVENVVRCVEKTTSFTNRPQVDYSNLTLCDFISESASANSINCNGKRGSHERVHFSTMLPDCTVESNIKDEASEAQNVVSGIYGNCLCLERYIDSIRPPLVDT